MSSHLAQGREHRNTPICTFQLNLRFQLSHFPLSHLKFKFQSCETQILFEKHEVKHEVGDSKYN